MKKAFFIFGIAAFLLPLSMTSCQKEESEPQKKVQNITKALWKSIDCFLSINHGTTVVHVIAYLEIGSDGEIIGGFIFVTPVTNDPNTTPPTYTYNYENQQLLDPNGEEVSVDEVFPGLLDAIQNYLRSI